MQVKVDASGSFDEEQNVQDNNSLYIFKLYYIDIPGKFYLLEKEEKNMKTHWKAKQLQRDINKATEAKRKLLKQIP